MKDKVNMDDVKKDRIISTYNEYLSIYFDKSTTELTGKNVGQELAQFTIEQLSKLESNTKRDQT